jgi:hypothetical protein
MQELDPGQAQRIASEPRVIAALQAWNAKGLNAATGRGHGVHPNEVAAQRAAREAGMPDGFYLHADGTITRRR